MSEGAVCVAPSSAEDSWRLVERAQAGDREAFGLIYEQYHPRVFAYIRGKTQSSQLAEDIAADVFVRALKNIGSFTWQGRDLGAWLVTIARNLVFDHFKSARNRLELTTGDVLDVDRADDDIATAPEHAALVRMANADLIEAIKNLGAEQRLCIALRFLEQMSVAETAQAMGKTESSIKALQHRAVRALRLDDPASRRRDPMASPMAPRLNGAPVVPMPRPPVLAASSVEALLAAAERLDHPRLARQAEKVRQAVGILRDLVEGHEKRAEAEERVARLRRQLAEAEAQLRGVATGSTPAVRATSPAVGPESRDIRAWAAAAGVECPGMGRVPGRVVDAYLAAHSAAAGDG